MITNFWIEHNGSLISVPPRHARWLNVWKCEGRLTPENVFEAFVMACVQGLQKTAKWLYPYAQGPECGWDYIFAKTCRFGHLKLVRWLHRVRPNLNIHHNDDKAFRGACKGGHPRIAQWLFSLGSVNVRARDDDAIKGAYREEHGQIVLWLGSIEPCYRTILCDDGSVEWNIQEAAPLTYDEQLHALGIRTVDVDAVCGICKQEKLVDIIVLPCSHTFCLQCLLEWKEYSVHNSCGYCRRPFRWDKCINVHRLFEFQRN